MDAYDTWSMEAELRRLEVRLLGTGAAAPTLVYGQTITVARSGVGVYTLTCAEYLGKYAGSTQGFDATVASGVAGYSAVLSVDTTGKIFTVSVFTSANAAVDLAAAQWLNLTLKIKAGSN